MKLYASVDKDLYYQFCKVNWLETNDDSLRRYLRDVGTLNLSVGKQKESFVEVPPGSCVRLHNSQDYIDKYHALFNTWNKVLPKKEVAEPVLSFWSRKWTWCW